MYLHLRHTMTTNHPLNSSAIILGLLLREDAGHDATERAASLTQTWLTEKLLNTGQEHPEYRSVDYRTYSTTNIQQWIREAIHCFILITHVLRQFSYANVCQPMFFSSCIRPFCHYFSTSIVLLKI